MKALLLAAFLPALAFAQVNPGCPNGGACILSNLRLTTPSTALKLVPGAKICWNWPTCTQVMSGDGANINMTGGIAMGNPAYLRGGVYSDFGNLTIATISAAHSYIYLKGNPTTSTSDVNVVVDTASAMTGSVSLFNVRNNGTDKFTVDNAGNIVTQGTINTGVNTLFAGVGTFGANTANASCTGSAGGSAPTSCGTSGTAGFKVYGNVADGASAVGVVIDNTTSLTTLGAKIVSVRNNGTEKLSVDKDGNLLLASHLSCTMAAGTTCTVTVPTGSLCICASRTGSASSVSCNVASTTATCTASASNSTTWNVLVY